MIINLNTIKKILIKIRKAYQQVGRREVAYLAVLFGDKVGLDAVEPRPPRVPQHHVVAHRAPACYYYHYIIFIIFCFLLQIIYRWLITTFNNGRGVCFLRRSPPTSGLAWMGRRGGALPWRGVCLFILRSPGSRREAQLCSVTGPNTIQDCRPDPPPLMGRGRPAPWRRELNLLGRPCDAGRVSKECLLADR